MNEENFARYYSKIAQTLNEIIPVKWTEIFMIYFEEEGVSSIGMYFKTKEGALNWCHNIPSEFHVDKDIYDSIEKGLRDICEAYKQAFIEENREEWTYMLFHLSASMEFDIKYYYDIDSNIDIHDMMDRIFYENYNIEPKGEFSKKRLYKYLEEKNSR